MPPLDHLKGKGKVISDKGKVYCATYQVMSASSRVDAPLPPPPPPPTKKARIECEKGELPVWATFSRGDPKVWMEILDDWHVDTTAKQALFLLAQYSEAGAMEANTIINKLHKKAGDGSMLANPSSFIHKCCCNAWTALKSMS